MSSLERENKVNNTKGRRMRPKIEKSAEEFKQHESILMNKRNGEVNNAVTKKCHVIWNQYLYDRPKPNPLEFQFVYSGIAKYLSVCDNYEPSQHKDPKQKWWNNQKASEMSQEFLPAVLNATDQMAEFLGRQISESLQTEFTNYCVFELLETAITSVFSTMRSGSNEVFLRTSFQYSKANLRKKLVAYFEEHELRPFDLKMRKKKDLWTKLIKEKKERLLRQFNAKKALLYGAGTGQPQKESVSASSIIKIQPSDDYLSNNINLPPSLQSDETMSCSTANNSSFSCSSNTNPIPPINWNESNVSNVQYHPFQTVALSAPYASNNIYNQVQSQNNNNMNMDNHNFKLNGYGNHRQCTDCLSYMNKMSELLTINTKLQHETTHLKQLNHQFIAERQQWRGKYQSLLLKFQQYHTNNTMNMDNNNGGDWIATTMEYNDTNNNNNNPATWV